MKSAKSLYIALFAVSLLVAGNVTVRARTTQQTGDQAKGDSSTAANSGKKNADSAATPKKNSSKSSAASRAAAAPVSKPPPIYLTRWQRNACCQANLDSGTDPRVNSAGMVWVNTDSGVYHKPGTRWCGKTKLGKYMTEADAPKAGYCAAAAVRTEKEIELVNLCAGLRAARGLNFLALTFRAG